MLGHNTTQSSSCSFASSALSSNAFVVSQASLQGEGVVLDVGEAGVAYSSFTQRLVVKT